MPHVANALSSAMVRGTEATTRSRAEKEKAKQVREADDVGRPADAERGVRAVRQPERAELRRAKRCTEIPTSHARRCRARQPLGGSARERRRTPSVATRRRRCGPPGGASIVERAGLDPDDKRVRALAEIVDGLHQLPRHRSIHVGGFVLTARAAVAASCRSSRRACRAAR